MTYRKKADEEARFFDAFDSQGNFLGNVKITNSVAFPNRGAINNGTFWQAEVDREGFTKIIKYRISD